MSKTLYLFPGQGAQHIGMGEELPRVYPAADEIFDRAEAATGLPVRQLCFEGPEEELTRTSNAQPCIFTVSAALLAALSETAPRPDACAGLSLGEYTAFYAAGAMDFETAVTLVAERGRLMQAAAEARPSGMVAVMGLDEERVDDLCDRARGDGVLTPANFNCPGQIVISGDSDACERAVALAEEEFEARATALNVAGAFHSDIMAPAADEFRTMLDGVSFAAPACPVVTNVDALPCTGAADIADRLIRQLTGAIRWHQSMVYFISRGMESAYEIGPGKTLKGLMRRIDRKVTVIPVNTASAVAELAAGQSGN